MTITVATANSTPFRSYGPTRPQAPSGRLLRLGLGSLYLALLLGATAMLGVADHSSQAESYDGRGKWSGYLAQQQVAQPPLTAQE